MPRLIGARMEKIHAPGAGIFLFSLFGGRMGDRKRSLVLSAARQSPFLFTSSHRVPVNAQPPALVMRLRKHLSGRRIAHARSHWAQRCLWLGFAGEPEAWLGLSLKDGAILSFEEPPAFEEPPWPDPGKPLPPREEFWDVLTPSLRRTLACMEAEEASALLADLQMGGGDVFLYEKGDACAVSAWPLPEKLCGGQKETVFSDVLAAMEKAGEKRVYGDLAARARSLAAKPFAAEAARLERLLGKLELEEKRLSAMQGKQADAMLLQSQLYRLDKDARLPSVTIEGTEGSMVLQLDPRLTVGENMAQLFHQAARGRRGLEHLSARREAVRRQKEEAEQSALRQSASVSGTGSGRQAAEGKTARALPSGLPSQVQAFMSSDGFIILRGRSAKGNLLALKLASPHDYWLHTAEGPGAHAIIRRSHAGQEVPERTLHEAGILAALKSWQKDQGHAEIQYSLAKFIHPMKNAPGGMVRIDRSEGSFRVELDAGLEDRLAGS